MKAKFPSDPWIFYKLMIVCFVFSIIFHIHFHLLCVGILQNFKFKLCYYSNLMLKEGTSFKLICTLKWKVWLILIILIVSLIFVLISSVMLIEISSLWGVGSLFDITNVVIEKGTHLLRYRSNWHILQNRIISFIVLSSDNTNCKNDIQLFHQLFDELSVYRDYH